MKRLRCFLVVLSLLGALGPAAAAAEPTTHEVRITQMQYSPSTIAVSAGDSIRFVNDDLVPHTVTAAGDQFDSGRIETGKDWTLQVKGEGRMDYYCQIHPAMKGAIEVDVK